MRIHFFSPLPASLASSLLLFLPLLLAGALPAHASTPSAKPPTLPVPRAAAKPASAASATAKVDPADLPKPDAVTCTGPACNAAPATVPELKPAAVGNRKEPPKLNAAATRSVNEAQHFANTSAVAPTVGKGGRVLFTYGDSIPTIVCSPLRVCDLELEAGENIQGAPHIGDSVRWRVSPAQSMEGDQKVTHLIIKATAADLDTNLIVPTDRRTYYVRLVSSEDKYVSRVAFDYPDNDERAWKRLAQQNRAQAAAARGKPGAAATAIDDLPAVATSRLFFNYKVTTSGNPKFRPVRVMDDGARVFITMSEGMGVDEAPVLFIVGPDGTEQIINYRLKGNIFVIDRLADKLALVSGTGKGEQRVDIVRDNCIKQGWFGRCAVAASTGSTVGATTGAE